MGTSGDFLNQPIPAPAVLDTAYMGELRRRARVRQGPKGWDPVMREAPDPSIFFNRPQG